MHKKNMVYTAVSALCISGLHWQSWIVSPDKIIRVQWGGLLIQYDRSVLLERKNLNTDMLTGEHHVEINPEIGVMLLQAKECQDCQQTTEARQKLKNRFSLTAPRKAKPTNTSIWDFWLPVL